MKTPKLDCGGKWRNTFCRETYRTRQYADDAWCYNYIVSIIPTMCNFCRIAVDGYKLYTTIFFNIIIIIIIIIALLLRHWAFLPPPKKQEQQWKIIRLFLMFLAKSWPSYIFIFTNSFVTSVVPCLIGPCHEMFHVNIFQQKNPTTAVHTFIF